VGFCGSIFPLIYEICVQKKFTNLLKVRWKLFPAALWQFLADGTEAGSNFSLPTTIYSTKGHRNQKHFMFIRSKFIKKSKPSFHEAC